MPPRPDARSSACPERSESRRDPCSSDETCPADSANDCAREQVTPACLLRASFRENVPGKWQQEPFAFSRGSLGGAQALDLTGRAEATA